MADIKIDKLVRSERTSIGLSIDRDARLIVRAPRYASTASIEKLIADKADWILKNQAKIAEQKSRRQVHSYMPGEVFYIAGEKHLLKFADNVKTVEAVQGELIIPAACMSDAKRLVENWYRAFARELIFERVMLYAPIVGVNYDSIKLSNAKTRWGSCGPGGKLRFSWKLAMAPVKMLDYVVVHELAHIAQPDHSKQFWRRVEAVLPDYKQRRKWFKENQYLFEI